MKNATYSNQAQQFRWRATWANGSTKPQSRFQPNPFGELPRKDDRGTLRNGSCDNCDWRGQCEVAQGAGGLVLDCTHWKSRKLVATTKTAEWWERSDGGRKLQQIPESEVRQIARNYYRDDFNLMDVCVKYRHSIAYLLRNCAKYGIELKRGITWDDAKERWGL